MVQKIRSVYSDSEIMYGDEDIGKWENFPQGFLQGNAGDSVIWNALSSVIFDILHCREFLVQFISSVSKQFFVLVGFSYVNDCSLLQAGDDTITVLKSMQSLINSWGSLMEVIARAIKQTKTGDTQWTIFGQELNGLQLIQGYTWIYLLKILTSKKCP